MVKSALLDVLCFDMLYRTALIVWVAPQLCNTATEEKPASSNASVTAGKQADLAFVDDKFNVLKVMQAGELCNIE